MTISDENPFSPPANASIAVRPPRRWPWFLGGFLIVFVGMSIGLKTVYMHPSGEYAVRCSLLQFYVTQLPGLFQLYQSLGPGSDGPKAAAMMLAQQTLCSLVGGLVALGLRRMWFKKVAMKA